MDLGDKIMALLIIWAIVILCIPALSINTTAIQDPITMLIFSFLIYIIAIAITVVILKR